MAARDAGGVTMTEGPLLGILIRVAVPIALSNLCQSTYDVVNGFWVGRLGEAAIAAVAASRLGYVQGDGRMTIRLWQGCPKVTAPFC
jgi:hypothetical protein